MEVTRLSQLETHSQLLTLLALEVPLENQIWRSVLGQEISNQNSVPLVPIITKLINKLTNRRRNNRKFKKKLRQMLEVKISKSINL